MFSKSALLSITMCILQVKWKKKKKNFRCNFNIRHRRPGDPARGDQAKCLSSLCGPWITLLASCQFCNKEPPLMDLVAPFSALTKHWTASLVVSACYKRSLCWWHPLWPTASSRCGSNSAPPRAFGQPLRLCSRDPLLWHSGHAGVSLWNVSCSRLYSADQIKNQQ